MKTAHQKPPAAIKQQGVSERRRLTMKYSDSDIDTLNRRRQSFALRSFSARFFTSSSYSTSFGS